MKNIVIIYIKVVNSRTDEITLSSLSQWYLVHQVMNVEKFHKEYSKKIKLELFKKIEISEDMYAELCQLME